MSLTTDEFGVPGVDRFIMVFKNRPTTAELRQLHTKHDAPEGDDADDAGAGGTSGTGDGNGDDGAAEELIMNEEEEEEDVYPYGDEDGDEDGGFSTQGSSSSFPKQKSSVNVSRRVPRLAAEKRESQRAKTAAEADEDTFELPSTRSGGTGAPAFKFDPYQPDLPSNAIKRKREEGNSEGTFKKVKVEDGGQ